MNEYKEKKKFKHKFLVFIIILIVINVALIPFTYKAFKSFATAVNPTPIAPVVEEYNYSDQEFVNLVYKYSCQDPKDTEEYYFYYDKNFVDVPALLDEAIKNNSYFKNRNEVITYMLSTKQTLKDDNVDILHSISIKANIVIEGQKVIINNKKINIKYYVTWHNNMDSEYRYGDFVNIILPEVEAFYNKGDNKK